METTNTLAAFLRDCRTRLDPVALGLPRHGRRTPGLRREEVAMRANISPTWYTWLEQGRGGAPSADVLDRIASGLMLSEREREHLFMLGQGRPPEATYRPVNEVPPRLQRLLDAFDTGPAILKTATWDIVAWNPASSILMMDYGSLPPDGRNLLRLIFADTHVRTLHEDWRAVARYAVGAFRAEATRAGATQEIARLVDELSAMSPEFAELWRDNKINAPAEGVKRFHHPQLGPLEFELSTLAVDGNPQLGLIVYNPVKAADAERIRAFVKAAS